MALPIPKKKLYTLIGKQARFAGCANVETQAPVFSMCKFENNLVTGHADGLMNFWILHIDPEEDQSKKIKLVVQYSIKVYLQAIHCMHVWNSCSLNDLKPLLATCGDQSIKIWKTDRTLFYEINCSLPVVSITVVNNFIVSGSYTGYLDVWKIHTGTEEQPPSERERRFTVSGLIGMSQKDHPANRPSESRTFSFFSKKKEPQTSPEPVRSTELPPTSIPPNNNNTDEAVSSTTFQATKLSSLLTRTTSMYQVFEFKGTFQQCLLCSSVRHDASIWTPTSKWPAFTLGSRVDGHRSSVRCFTEWNQHLVTGSVDSTIKIWIVASDNTNISLKCRMTLEGHKSWVTSLCIWENHLCSGSKDKSIRIWNWKGECVSMFLCHKDDVTCMALWNNFLFAGSYDKLLSVWQGEVAEVSAYIV